MPSTIREKPGDSESALWKTFEWIMKGHRTPGLYKRVRVSVSVFEYEDGLPADMSDADYDEWYKRSRLIEGVRMAEIR